MHEIGHPHTHEHHDHPGLFHERDAPISRDYEARSFTVGIGGPVGSGKTALMLALCRALRDTHSLGVVTNDIFTREDAEFLVRNKALDETRIRAVETGGCPHAAIREDISHNLVALEELMEEVRPSLLLVESGGDNLAAQFSRELVATKSRAKAARASRSRTCSSSTRRTWPRSSARIWASWPATRRACAATARRCSRRSPMALEWKRSCAIWSRHGNGR